MGYGKNLQKALKDNNMSVRDLAKRLKMSPNTLYSIISRDTAVRFDHALRIANILGIDPSLISKTDPYEEEPELPEMLSEMNGVTTRFNKTSYIKNRTNKILMLFDYKELPKVDQLLTDWYQLDDEGREMMFKMAAGIKLTNTDKGRKKKLKEV